MASIQTDAKLRIGVALIVVALAVTSLLLVWRPGVEMGFRILQSLGFAAMLFLAATIVVGKTKAGRLVLTRRRWKYFTLIGLFIAVIITFVVAAPNLDRPWANSVLSVFPLVLGGFVAQLYEPESSAQFKASDLSDQDAKTWKRISLVLALIGAIIGCIAGIGGVTGNIVVFALLWPIGLLCLVFAFAIWMMLRRRNWQLGAKP